MPYKPRSFHVEPDDVVWHYVVDSFDLIEQVRKRLDILYDDSWYDLGLSVLAYCTKYYEPWMGRFRAYAKRSMERAFSEERGWRLERLLFDEEMPDNLSDERILIEHDQRDTVYYLMGKLNRFDKTLIVLRFWRGLTYEEIGSLIGVSRSTVCLHYKRILGRCKEMLR